MPADGGVHVFTAGVTLTSSGLQTITATDTAVNALNISASVFVITGALARFGFAAPNGIPPGTTFAFTVMAQDPFGNTVTGYAGTVGFTSSDNQAILPAKTTLINGVGTFSATLNTPGKQTLTATDSSNAAIVGSAVIHAATTAGIAPYVQSITRASPPTAVTNATNVTFTVTFSQPVIGVNISDFAVATTGTATGAVTQVTPVSGAVYAVTVSGIAGKGTVGLNLVDDGSIVSLIGHPLTQPNAPAAFASNGTLVFATGSIPLSVASGDLTGDGIPDLVVANERANTVSVLIGNGNGTFKPQQTIAVDAQPYSVVLADLTGDGKLDIVLGSSAIYGAVSVLLGNGNGTFQAPLFYLTGAGAFAVAVGDVTGDGKPDIVVATVLRDAVSVLLGNGNGTFQAQQTFATGSERALALGDVNGDGNLDIVVDTYVGNAGNAVGVLLGNGNGTFQAEQNVAASNNPFSVAVGDVNGDGNADIVVANETSNTVSVLLSNGNSTFQALRHTPREIARCRWCLAM